MKEAINHTPGSIGVNNAKDRITIFFSDLDKKLVLEGVAICYDLGIIGKQVSEISQRKELGTDFEYEIRSSGKNPADYIWIQIIASDENFDTRVLEGAVKKISLKKKLEYDQY